MKGKDLILVLALVVLLGGGMVLYNAMKDRAAPAPISPLAGIERIETETEGAEEQRVAAPDFTVEDEDGNSVRLSDMLGKPVVINFWASWCPPCRMEMPDFNKVFEEMGDEVNFMMVNAVGSRGETKQAAARYVAREGFTFPVFYDVEQAAVTSYGVRAFPTSVFIDSEGYVLGGVEGAIDERTLRLGLELIREHP